MNDEISPLTKEERDTAIALMHQLSFGSDSFLLRRLITTINNLDEQVVRLEDRLANDVRTHERGDCATLRATVDRYRVALDIIATDGHILDPVKLQEVAKRALMINPPSHAEV